VSSTRLSEFLADGVIAPKVRVVQPSELTAVMEKMDARQLRERVVIDMAKIHD